MLKRNGQPCQRSVPDYSGRLTDFEFLAYNTVFTSLEDDFRQLSAITDSLTEVERSMPRLLDACADSAKKFSEVVPGDDSSSWELVASLLKLQKTELMLCKRQAADGREFSIIERLDPDSPLAKAKGIWQVQMTSNDARLLLQDFVEGERQTLHLYSADMLAMAREAVEEKFPGRDLGPVIKAISQRCRNAISTEEVVPIQTRKQSEGVRV